MHNLIKEVEVDEKAANRGFEDGLILATDVAEYLVLQGVPFRNAHEKVGHIVRYCIETKKPLTSLTIQEWQSKIPEVKEDLLPLLTPRRSMERRDTVGGTAPKQVRLQIKDAKVRLAIYDREAKEMRDCQRILILKNSQSLKTAP